MNILHLIVAIAIVGVVLYVVNAVVPMEPRIKTILNAVVIVLLCLWLLDVFFGLGSIFVFPRRH